MSIVASSPRMSGQNLSGVPTGQPPMVTLSNFAMAPFPEQSETWNAFTVLKISNENTIVVNNLTKLKPVIFGYNLNIYWRSNSVRN